MGNISFHSLSIREQENFSCVALLYFFEERTNIFSSIFCIEYQLPYGVRIAKFLGWCREKVNLKLSPLEMLIGYTCNTDNLLLSSATEEAHPARRTTINKII